MRNCNSETRNYPPTVLLTDDDDSLRELVAAYLSASGFQVLHASGGQQALRISQNYEDQIDLLLTDIDLGSEMSGIELAKQFHRERPETKILLMSGSYLETDVQGEGWEFIQKPFRVEGLKRKMQSVFG